MDVDALAAAAGPVLDPAAYDYFATGADDEITLRANRQAWNRWSIRPRVLRDVARVDTGATLLGARVRAPILIAPMAYQRLADPDGEIAMARGADASGVGMVLSTMSTVTLEDVAAATPNALRWFQLYVHVDRTMTTTLVRRAEAAGYRALVVTVDTPELGRRARHGPSGFHLPPGLTVANLVAPPGASGSDSGGAPGGIPGGISGGISGGTDAADIGAYAATMFDPSLTPAAIAWLVAQTSLPVVVKGVLRGDDAAAVVDAGAAAVCVSNHGGRQLDGAIATAAALADVVAGVAGRADVYVDGGITRGTDVLRALALGASAVWIGRPALWGLAVGGADGVRAVFDTLVEETRLAFTLAGVRAVVEATPDLLHPFPR